MTPVTVSELEHENARLRHALKQIAIPFLCYTDPTGNIYGDDGPSREACRHIADAALHGVSARNHSQPTTLTLLPKYVSALATWEAMS